MSIDYEKLVKEVYPAEQTAVYIHKDGVELKSFGGNFDFAIDSSIEYLNRINNIQSPSK